MMDKEDIAAALALLKRVDWPRVLHTASTFMRAVRGDRDIDTDAERAKRGGERAYGAVKSAGRVAAGCRAPGDCACAFCAEEKESTK